MHHFQCAFVLHFGWRCEVFWDSQVRKENTGEKKMGRPPQVRYHQEPRAAHYSKADQDVGKKTFYETTPGNRSRALSLSYRKSFSVLVSKPPDTVRGAFCRRGWWSGCDRIKQLFLPPFLFLDLNDEPLAQMVRKRSRRDAFHADGQQPNKKGGN